MTGKLPDFLGIGAMRAGSTLLYDLLKSHPDIYVPPYRKEVRYFDEYYNRGEDWYESFFDGAKGHIAGEVTPTYLYSEEVRKRIKEDLDDVKFLVILRDPVKRAYSHFKHAYLKKNTGVDSFEGFLEERPDAKERGLYGEHLSEWIGAFGRDQVCIVLLEDVEDEIEKIGNHLGVPVEGFETDVLSKSSNSSFMPYSRVLYHHLNRIGQTLRYVGMDRVVEKTRPLVDSFLTLNKEFPPLTAETENNLRHYYEDDVKQLQGILGRELDVWDI
mgnify:CR=1 FL=1